MHGVNILFESLKDSKSIFTPYRSGKTRKCLLIKTRKVYFKWPDIFPKDISPNGHFADGRFAERTLVAERTTCRK